MLRREAMASVNKVIIVGNLGRDPEVSYTPSGMAVARLNIATTDTWTDRATGERKDKTEWHRVVVFNKQAENCGRYLTKGRQVYVEGRLQTSSYEKDGVTRYTTDIIASVIQFLGGKSEGGYSNQQGAQGGGYPQGNNAQPGGGYQNPGGGFQQPGRGFQGGGAKPQQQPPQPQYDYEPSFDSDPGFTPPPDDDIPF